MSATRHYEFVVLYRSERGLTTGHVSWDGEEEPDPHATAIRMAASQAVGDSGFAADVQAWAFEIVGEGRRVLRSVKVVVE